MVTYFITDSFACCSVVLQLHERVHSSCSYMPGLITDLERMNLVIAGLDKEYQSYLNKQVRLASCHLLRHCGRGAALSVTSMLHMCMLPGKGTCAMFHHCVGIP